MTDKPAYIPPPGVSRRTYTKAELDDLVSSNVVRVSPDVDLSEYLQPQYLRRTSEEQVMARLKSDLGEIRSAVEELQKERGGTAAVEIQVANVVDKLKGLEESAAALTAPVLIPSKADLALRLVPIDTVRRIEEYSEDFALYLSLAGITGGAGLSAALSAQTTPGATVLLLAGATAIFLWRAYATRQRKLGLRERETTYTPVRIAQPERAEPMSADGVSGLVGG